MILVCRVCRSEFRTEDKRRKYCGLACYAVKSAAAPSSGAFSPGRAPWNKGAKGLHLSPSTEFRKGARPVNVLPVGSIRVRHRQRRSDERAWVKIAEPNAWRLRSVVVWEAGNGPLPGGMVIHHLDHDSLNDALENLEALTRSEHLRHHRPEFEIKRLANLRSARAGQLPLLPLAEGMP